MEIVEYQNAQDICGSLVSSGWRTPNTYNNYYDEPTDGPAVYLFLIYGIDADYGCPDLENAFVAYVGMSRQLRKRWAAHPTLRELNSYGRYLQRWFCVVDTGLLRVKERELIEKYDPPWNIQCKKRGVSLI